MRTIEFSGPDLAPQDATEGDVLLVTYRSGKSDRFRLVNGKWEREEFRDGAWRVEGAKERT